jgi:hypothetical protein
MADVRRRDLLLGAGAVAAVGGGAAVAVAASGDPSKPLTIDVSKGMPTLPQDSELYRFPLTSAKPTAVTPGPLHPQRRAGHDEVRRCLQQQPARRHRPFDDVRRDADQHLQPDTLPVRRAA